MDINELKQRVDLLEYVRGQGHDPVKVGSQEYRVNPCPVCNRKDHFTIYPATNSYSSFSDCVNGGSILDYFIEIEGLSQEKAIEKLKRLAGVENQTKQPFKANKRIKKSPVASQTTEQTEAEIQPLEQQRISILADNIDKWQGNLMKTARITHKLRNRGLSTETIKKNLIGYGDLETQNGKTLKDVIIFPNIARNGIPLTLMAEYVNRTNTLKYYKQKPDIPYKLYHLETSDPVFITEGIYDMLSIEQAGYKAVAINGTNNINKLQDYINTKALVISALDGDKAGYKANQQLKDLFRRPITELDYPIDIKDPNEFLVKAPEQFHAELKKAIERATKERDKIELRYKDETSIKKYLVEQFAEDIKAYNRHSEIKTGFNLLDSVLKGVHAGLYVLGGVSATGKTTLLHQIADNLATSGKDIFYISLEQGKFELLTKSLTRATYQQDKSLDISKYTVLKAYKTEQEQRAVYRATEEYTEKTAPNMNIIEGNFNFNLSELEKRIHDHIRITGNTPIIIIDYLQILPPLTTGLTDKQAVDTNVTALKRMARDYKTAVFVVSSMNRRSYTQEIGYESFKESGGIEYTADVLLGLQDGILSDTEYQQLNDKYKAKIHKAGKQLYPRELELVVLKNRFGTCNTSVNFKFYYKAEYFKDTLERPDMERYENHARAES